MIYLSLICLGMILKQKSNFYPQLYAIKKTDKDTQKSKANLHNVLFGIQTIPYPYH